MPSNSFPNRPTFLPQEKPSTCAVACLRMVLSAYGVALSEAELAQKAKTNEIGTELGNLVLAASELGFACQAVPPDWDLLRQALYPIVYLDGHTLGRGFFMHSVVVLEIKEPSVSVLDPAQGEIEIPIERFRDAWETAGCFAVVLGPNS